MEGQRSALATIGGHWLADNTVLFLGDSLTAGGDWQAWFPDVNALNFGIGGDTSDDVIARLDTVIAADPDEIVLLIGTNDFGHRQNVEHLVRNVQSILVEARRALPGSRLLVQSIMPRGREFADRIQRRISTSASFRRPCTRSTSTSGRCSLSMTENSIRRSPTTGCT